MATARRHHLNLWPGLTETADSVFLLAKGLAKVAHLTGDGKESTLAFVEAGELFGELALFDGERRDECSGLLAIFLFPQYPDLHG